MNAEVCYINMDQIAPIVNREGWDSKDPRVVAYNDVQFPREAEGRTLADAVRALLNTGCYQTVATVMVDDRLKDEAALESVWTNCQNIFESWTGGDRVAQLYNGANEGARSMSVGDLVRYRGRLYVVARVGFEEV